MERGKEWGGRESLYKKRDLKEVIQDTIIREESSREQELRLQSLVLGVYLAHLRNKVSVTGAQ